jgi:hypothetical protein
MCQQGQQTQKESLATRSGCVRLALPPNFCGKQRGEGKVKGLTPLRSLRSLRVVLGGAACVVLLDQVATSAADPPQPSC